MRKIALLFFLCFPLIYTSAQYPPVKYEMRGVWIAALGIDWPGTTGTTASAEESQKNQLVSIMDSHKSYGMNALYLHMRPLGDALYKSEIEPWSHYITGKQGTPPSNPDYDPLAFAVKEAHKRGMELHAWLNPYRLLGSGGDPSIFAPNHVAKEHPEWVIKCTTSEYRFLNPGLPAVREYVTSVVMDIVRRYDVDGIHFDDYFYPYTDYGPFNDDATFQQYPYGYTSKADWRKNNVNLLLKMMNDSISTVKPWVKLTISPSGNPSVNTSIFCDPKAWLAGTYTDSLGVAHDEDPYIDAIIPQLYWVAYNGNLPSWTGSSFLNGRQLYVGHAAYRYGEKSWPANEGSNQIKVNRNTPSVNGGVYFSSKSLTNNLAGINDTLKYNYYAHPAIPPKMAWKNLNSAPNAPSNVRFVQNTTTGKYELYWDKPEATAQGDTAFAYIVYRSSTPDINTSDAKNIFGINGETYLSLNDSKYSITKGLYYAVAAFDRNSNESPLSAVVTFDSTGLVPSKPVLVAPSHGDDNQPSTTTLSWQSTEKAERYSIQVSTEPDFSKDFYLEVYEFKGTSLKFNKVLPGTTYFWRVKAHGQGGDSDYPTPFSFGSGIPGAPELGEPIHATTGVALKPLFNWYKTAKAATYQLQVATTIQFYDNSIVLDKIVYDTSYASSVELALNKIHYWRVAAKNTLGTGPWSKTNGFRTQATVGVEDEEEIPSEYKLNQNYPNPFNPSTSISYELKNPGYVSLKIYDILGNEVSTLVNQYQQAGRYKVQVNINEAMRRMTSGIYMYTLRTEGFNFTRKMLLLK